MSKPFCRDRGDENGTCPHTGEPCDPMNDASEMMCITIEKYPRCHWHTNCSESRSGILKIVREEPENERTLFECLHCGKYGYLASGTPWGGPWPVPVVSLAIEEGNK